MPKVTGYTPASGPPADRSGVVRASITEKARPSSHSPAPHSDNMALIHTSATTAPAASPSTQNGSSGRHDSTPSSAAGSAGKASTVGSADAGEAVTTQMSAVRMKTTTSTRGGIGSPRPSRERLDIAQLPVAGRDRGLGSRPD